MWCMRGNSVHRRLPRKWKMPASEKQLPEKEKRKGCRNHFCNRFPCAYRTFRHFKKLFSPDWRSPIIPNFDSTPNRRAAPSARMKTHLLVYHIPSSSRVNHVVVLLETFKLLSITLSCLICWIDWTISFASTFNVFFVQLTIRVLHFTKNQDVASSDLVFLLYLQRCASSSPIVAFSSGVAS